MPTLSQHRALEHLVARYLVANPDKMASTTTVLELIVWSGSHLEPAPDAEFIPPDTNPMIGPPPQWIHFGVPESEFIPPDTNPMIGGSTHTISGTPMQPLEAPQTLASEAKQARDSIASSAQALAPGSIASQRRQGGPAMPMPPPAPRGF